jgi:hypothetical protein
MSLTDIGRLLVGAGVVIAVVGGVLMLAGRLGLGRLPGDFSFGTGNVRVYVPLATALIISVVATLLLNIFLRR